EDVAAAVRATLETLDLSRTIRPGHTVALTAGSRGIANIPLVLRAVADFLKKLGARPFLVPAMGSHGGGTAEGQRRILESYGITEEVVGVPLRASMGVVGRGARRGAPPGFDGCRRAGYHSRRFPGPPRSTRVRGRPHWRNRPGQAAHRF